MQKLAAIGGAVFVQGLGAVFRSLIPGLIDELFSIPGVQPLMAITQPGVFATLKGLQSNKDIPKVPLTDIIDRAEEVVGAGDTAAKIDEMVKEIKMTNWILSNTSMKHDKEGAVNAVYETLVYAD
jgi:hypothetical protein